MTGTDIYTYHYNENTIIIKRYEFLVFSCRVSVRCCMKNASTKELIRCRTDTFMHLGNYMQIGYISRDINVMFNK